MKLLIVGGGGREHAIAWKLSQSPRVSQIYAAPGNAGIAELGECVPLAATDFDGLIRFAQEKRIDLVVVAPDDPLALGLVDRLEAVGIPAFGPTAAAARIESSKAFSKSLMRQAGIPTADYQVVTTLSDALAAIDTVDLPVVVKADGLALGKGVIIARTRSEAVAAVTDMMEHDRFGKAGHTIILETCLSGPELTVLAFTDGKTIRPMRSSRDHKRAFDHDLGPNTGGMGAVSPGAELSAMQWKDLQQTVFQPTIDALRAMGCPFKGVIYFGLMLTEDGPRVIEYNARFGDPEAQAVLPLLKTDLLEIFEAVIDERLDQMEIEWSDQASCCVVAASGGYPVAYEKGYPITGLTDAAVHGLIFHAGTARQDGALVTAGGRVLALTAVAETLEEAINKAYQGMESIRFTGMQMRKDIGQT